MKCRYSILLLVATIVGFLSTGLCSAAKNRAVWFWASSSSEYGASNIVGSADKETETVDFFNAQGIKHVYGSYQSRSIDEPETIADWNALLDAEGIESQFLMSENSWIFADNHAGFLKKVTERVIEFNTGRPANEQFDGLHLDIEPQALSDWSELSDTGKCDYLYLLGDTYAAVRTHFVTNDLPDFPVYADLPVWFDNLDSIGWTNTVERDAWFAAISTNLTGVSLMPFDRDSFSSIDNGVTWERSHITNASVRVGLESDIGSSGTWSDSLEFDAMLETLESNYGVDDAVDIQAYAIWQQALSDESFSNLTLEMDAVPADNQAILNFEMSNDTTCAVFYSTNLCNWLEIDRFLAPSTTTTNFTVSMTNNIGFWKACYFIPIE